MRTVSLLPSATEIVGALGATPDLVGRSHRCNYPPAVLDRPVVTRSTYGQHRPTDPATIDAAVEAHAHGEHSAFQVQTDALAELAPELILTQNLCEVCAVPESMSVTAIDQLATSPTLVSVGPTTIAEIFDSIEMIGDAMERPVEASRLIDSLQLRIETMQSSIPESVDPPRIACIEWVDPLRAHGLWIPDILARLGISDPFVQPGENGREIEWDELIQHDPELLFVSPCGKTIPEIEADMKQLVSHPQWESITTVKDDRVYVLDGEISSRHGPRVIRTLELIASRMYPDDISTITPSTDEIRSYSPQ